MSRSVFIFTLRLAAAVWLFAVMPACVSASGDEAADQGPTLSELAGDFRRHCVRVYITGKTHEGKAPAVGEFATDIRNERPTPVGGYWWDERHVVVADPGLQEHFIRSIEIGMPYSDARFPAKLAGRFIKLQALLIEVLPDETGALPTARPLEFVDGDIESSVVLSYLWENGDWRIKADTGLGAGTISDSGAEMVHLSAEGVLVAEDGKALGLAFGEKVTLDEEFDYWCGRMLSYTPILGETEKEGKRSEMRRALADAVLETRFHLRVKVDDDEDAREWSFDIEDDSRGKAAEARAAGLVVGPRHLFVPVPLNADGIARIERIEVVGPDGRPIPASFSGAFRDYQAILVETGADLPNDSPPAGFSRLNPLLLPDDIFEPSADVPAHPEMEYFQRWRIDYALGRRRESADGDRWLGTFRGYRGDTTVHTLTNEEDGSLAFDLQGRLVAVALTPRVLPSGVGRAAGRQKASAGFKPLDHLYARFHEPDVFDPALVPVDEENGRRLIDFGIEYQGLDANTARLFHAAEATRGGRIGLLVTHVYPDTPAAKAGIREHDVLLRMFIAGRTEPNELSAGHGGQGGGLFDMSDMSSASFQQMLAFMPPPWPARDNDLNIMLTTAGSGREVRVDYLREGEPVHAEFVTGYTEADYRNAHKEKFDMLGLTVKPVTYEVARYFRRPDRDGVIVSRVEEGSKAAVSGLHHYLLVTHVDGVAIGGMDDFREKMRRFESGESRSVELTVGGFGKTRLVKIE